MFKKISIFTIIIFILTAISAQAVGVSVTPSKLLIETQANQIAKTTITVKNPSDAVGIYDVYVDEYSERIKIEPRSFTLEAGETKEVKLEIKSPQEEVFATNISVVAKPLSPRAFQANSGIKVPIETRVSDSTQKIISWAKIFTFTNIILGIDVILALILLGVWIRRIKS